MSGLDLVKSVGSVFRLDLVISGGTGEGKLVGGGFCLLDVAGGGIVIVAEVGGESFDLFTG